MTTLQEYELKQLIARIIYSGNRHQIEEEQKKYLAEIKKILKAE